MTATTNKIMLFFPPELSPMLPQIPASFIYGTLRDPGTGMPAEPQRIEDILAKAQADKTNVTIQGGWPVRAAVELGQQGGHQFGVFPLTPFDDTNGSDYFLPVFYAVLPGPYMVAELDRCVDNAKVTLAAKRSNLVPGRPGNPTTGPGLKMV